MYIWERIMNPPKITEICKLHDLLVEAGIQHEYLDRRQQFDPDGLIKDMGFDHDYGWQIVVYDEDGRRIISAIEGFGTYGVESDRIEIMGLLTKEESKYDCVLGGLTAEEVFERIKKAEGVVFA